MRNGMEKNWLKYFDEKIVLMFFQKQLSRLVLCNTRSFFAMFENVFRAFIALIYLGIIHLVCTQNYQKTEIS